jgi:peroxisomal membrane protein 2
MAGSFVLCSLLYIVGLARHYQLHVSAFLQSSSSSLSCRQSVAAQYYYCGSSRASSTNNFVASSSLVKRVSLIKPYYYGTQQQRRSFSTTVTTTSSLHLAGGLLEDVWSSYLTALESDPLLVKSITAGVILGAADLSGQAIQQSLLLSSVKDDSDGGDETSKGGKEVDIARFVRFAFFGFILQAPWNHYYYQYLDNALPPTIDPFSTTTAIKVAIDQFIQAPLFTILIFGFLGVLEGKTIDEIKKQLDDDYVDTMLANWKLWVPATAVNIAFCPPILRVLFLNVVFFFWSIFLSLKLNKNDE